MVAGVLGDGGEYVSILVVIGGFKDEKQGSRKDFNKSQMYNVK